MKTPVWIPSLILVVAWAFASHAQNETNRIASPFPALPSPIAHAADKDSTLLGRSRSSPLRFSHWTSEIVQLAQSGIDESVMLAFIGNSGVFNLGADHIIYLNELGVSSRVVSAMLLHDRDLMPDPIKSAVIDELDVQPAVITAHGDDGDSVIKPGDSSAIPLITAMADATDGKSLPETDPSFLAAPVASAQKSDLVGPPAPNQQPSPQKGRTLYPVRAPYPVELTAPIVFLDAPSF